MGQTDAKGLRREFLSLLGYTVMSGLLGVFLIVLRLPEQMVLPLVVPVFLAAMRRPRWPYLARTVVFISVMVWVTFYMSQNFEESQKTLVTAAIVLPPTCELLRWLMLKRLSAEEALRESEHQYRQLVENSPDAIVVSCDDRIVYANTTAFRLAGELGVSTLLGTPTLDFVDPANRERATERMRKAVKEREALPMQEQTLVLPTGGKVEVESVSLPFTHEGRPAAQIVLRDISARKRAERLARMERELAFALSSTSELDEVLQLCLQTALTATGMDCGGVYVRDVDTGALTLIAHTGLSREVTEAVASHSAHSEYARIVAEGRPRYGQLSELFQNNAPRLNQEGLRALAVTPILHHGKVIGSLNVASHSEDVIVDWVRDALETIAAEIGGAIARTRTEEALRESEQRFRLLAENLPGVIYLCRDAERRETVYLNGEVAQLTGHPKEEFLGGRLNLADLIHPEDLGRVLADTKTALARRQAFRIVYRIRHAQADWRWIEEAGDGIFRDDNVAFIEGFLSDITERRRAEEERRKLEAQVQHAQKLESLGVLAGGIAHDFNNLLVGILGNASLAESDLPPESPVREYIAQIETAAQRAADLAREMLAYSGRGQFVVQALDLSALVKDMVNLLEVSIPKKVALQYGLSASLPAIKGDPTQLRQVLMNLITNAAEAVGEQGGIINVQTGVMQADAQYLETTFLNEDLPESDYVYVEVSDTGKGMAPGTVARIFDPFFTTKTTGRGLGLAAVLGIVRGHRGAIKVYSEVGRGTTMKVLFPVTDEKAKALAQDTAAAQDEVMTWRGSGLILVVDDEASVRRVAERALTRAGFSVLTAEDGEVAIAIFQERSDDIAAVLLDMTMPKMGGEETFKEMRRLKADVRVVLSSGYNEQEATRQFLGKGLAGFIQKPYRAANLIEQIRKVLEK